MNPLAKISSSCWRNRSFMVLVSSAYSTPPTSWSSIGTIIRITPGLHNADRPTSNRGVIKGTTGSSFISRITGSRILIRLALIIAVSLSITGAVQANTGSTQKTINQGKRLKTIGVVIFLVIASLLAVHSLFSIVAESSRTPGKRIPAKRSARPQR